MKKINWSGYKWITQEVWGQVHEDKKWCYYDETAVSVDSNEILHLLTHYNPNEFEIKGLKFTSPFGVGLISSEERFSHGLFEIECKLPKGKNLWPAFWVWGADSWPPEIDFFEAYTNKRGSYFSPSIWPPALWDVQTNIHYRTTGNKEGRSSIGAKPGWMGWKNPSKHFFKYECLWTPEFIEIKYNGKVVKVFDDIKIMADINSQKHRVIINNQLRHDGNEKQVSDFQIKSFKYTPLNKL